ncbi:alpha/beta hydrolase [Schleiferilactobacillus perolens]|uniref:Xylan esterase lipase n=1 Tax=Schleiferilactobacillus perolens DSM 12744 TaxID=1423792 RepID=A0A0R1NE51_9LACO|nr:alpha/beta hydrolase [Schleiferilactobacillus perolens]KRL14568.1 xylan esterase lipase [Schleiferilactobacillus perolens DSM 12744]
MEIVTHKLSTSLSQTATLTGYIQTPTEEIPGKEHRPAILIMPGGGYTMVSAREAEPVALAFASHGFQAFILHYSVLPVMWPVPLLEAAEAMHQIRAHADAWFLDPDQVATLGFSAGGHLAAAISTLADSSFLTEQGYKAADVRPNALMLGYALVSFAAMAASRVNSDDGLTSALRTKGIDKLPLFKEASELEKQVTNATPPTFLWATAPDQVVPVQNSLAFAEALNAAKVPFSLHIFPQGHHGLSLANALTRGRSGDQDLEPSVTPWLSLSLQWLQLLFPDAGITA